MDKPLQNSPLAERMRPLALDQFVGQEKILLRAGLKKSILEDKIGSMILWGPPGVGKTTLANIVARETKRDFLQYSAVTSGIKQVREVMQQAEAIFRQTGNSTILFVDEIHRFNKAQQDAFLPFVERGEIILIGATTENPSFEIITPLLSRLQIFRLEQLTEEDIGQILKNALDSSTGYNGQYPQNQEVISFIISRSGGDGRRALMMMEIVIRELGDNQADQEKLEQIFSSTSFWYDKRGDQHFNLISALHKSLRNSDHQASLYWLARMLTAGEDPLYIARRMVRFASEDVGLADPQALQVAMAAKDSVHFLGMPEGNLALAQAAVYLATAPKSNALYFAYKKIEKDLKKGKAFPPPLHICNAPTSLMKKEGYGKGYQYAHNLKEKVANMECLPSQLSGTVYYQPGPMGFEKSIAARIDYWQRMKDGLHKEQDDQ